LREPFHYGSKFPPCVETETDADVHTVQKKDDADYFRRSLCSAVTGMNKQADVFKL
jgi:hypothetical protein